MPTLNSLATLPHAFNHGPLTVHRPASTPAQNDFGGFDAPTDREFTLNPVTVHPHTPRTLEQETAADANREHVKLYTLERLYAADGGNNADRVEWNGRTYRVISVEDFEKQGAVFIVVAVLEEVTA